MKTSIRENPGKRLWGRCCYDTRMTVHKWWRRFAEESLAALADHDRPGRLVAELVLTDAERINAADMAGVAADFLGELGLGQALLGAQLGERSGRNGLGMWCLPWSSREVHCAALMTVVPASGGVVACHEVHLMA